MQTLDQRARDQIQGSGYAMQTTPYAEVELGSSWTLVRQNSQRSTSFHSQVVILVGQLPACMVFPGLLPAPVTAGCMAGRRNPRDLQNS